MGLLIKIEVIAVLYRCEQQTRTLSGRLINEDYGNWMFSPVEFVDFKSKVNSHISHLQYEQLEQEFPPGSHCIVVD